MQSNQWLNLGLAFAGELVASNPAPSHERAWYTLFMHAFRWSMGEHAVL